MPGILFVCTANRYRSPIAEAYFREILSRQGLESSWEVRSAGTWTEDGWPPMPEAVEIAAQYGLDIRQHRSSVISEPLIRGADLVLVMESGQKEALQVEFSVYRAKIRMLSEVVNGLAVDLPDPVRYASDHSIIPELIKMLETGSEKILAAARR